MTDSTSRLEGVLVDIAELESRLRALQTTGIGEHQSALYSCYEKQLIILRKEESCLKMEFLPGMYMSFAVWVLILCTVPDDQQPITVQKFGLMWLKEFGSPPAAYFVSSEEELRIAYNQRRMVEVVEDIELTKGFIRHLERLPADDRLDHILCQNEFLLELMETKMTLDAERIPCKPRSPNCN